MYIAYVIAFKQYCVALWSIYEAAWSVHIK